MVEMMETVGALIITNSGLWEFRKWVIIWPYSKG